MNILQASSEFFPYSKTGGLADMVASLSGALARAGHRVDVVTPLYRNIQNRFPDLIKAGILESIPLDGELYTPQLWCLNPEPHLHIHFIDEPAFFDRPSLYGEKNASYPDNAKRFIFFSQSVTQLARTLRPMPVLLHAHDWQTGLVPPLQRHATREGGACKPTTVFTVHNAAYQGRFDASKFSLTGLPSDYFGMDQLEFYGDLNCLKGGVVFADLVTTVSPGYARELLTTELGCGLEGVFRLRGEAFSGILNGVDYSKWNTTQNPYLPATYSANAPKGKSLNKHALQREMGLPICTDVPLFGSVTRLAEQKGIDILLPALRDILEQNVQFVLLGSGDPDYQKALQKLALKHPMKTAVKIGYDQGLAHRIEAASDFFLMPSRFEPCGLNQLYSLRYGTVPIVRATGGLDDSIQGLETGEAATGIKFSDYSGEALVNAIEQALTLFGQSNKINRLRDTGMRADFSWNKTSLQYLKLYEQAIADTKG